LNALIAFSIKQRVLVLALFVMTFIGGVLAFRQLNIEAYPDPTPPMVDIITQSPGLSAEEIERYITIPIETQTSALRNLNTVRTISLYGLSDVKLQFTFDYTYEEALQQVLNRRSRLSGHCPNAVGVADPDVFVIDPGLAPTTEAPHSARAADISAPRRNRLLWLGRLRLVLT